MNYFTKSRIYVFLIILLALLNVTLMLFIWKGPPSKSGRPSLGLSQAKSEFFLARELELSEEQVEEYNQLRKVHFQEVGQEVSKMRRLKTELFDLVGEKNNGEKKQRLLGQIGETQSTIDSLTFIHFENLRNICDDAQQLRFDSVIKKVMHRLDRQGPHRHGGRRGR